MKCNNCLTEIIRKDKPDDQPGTVYSDAGWLELSITGFCETCFDRITAEPDEDWTGDSPEWNEFR